MQKRFNGVNKKAQDTQKVKSFRLEEY